MSADRVEPLCSTSAPAPGLVAREGDRVLLWSRTTAERDKRLASQVRGSSLGVFLRGVAAEALAGPDMSLVAIGIEPDRVVVLARGAVRVEVRGATAETSDLVDGSSSLTIVERALALPLHSIRAHLGEPHDTAGDGPTHLGSGVVPAAGVLVGWAVRPETAPPAPALLPAACGCARAAVPEQQPPVAPEPAVLVDAVPDAVACASGHVNAHDTIYCTICGIGMAQSGVTSARVPPSFSPGSDDGSDYGVLVVDDGTVLSVRGPVVCGSAPETQPDVRAGRADAVRIPDTQPVHCRFSVHAGRVHVHNVGAAALAIRAGQDPTWQSLRVGHEVALASDSVLALGDRQLRYVGRPELVGGA
ncbi:FHA domain-containing protein [Nocardioides plantarum]|uniref:FHA domain-containing protein n=1 Tax=Nocardioides plantarum TaxID=29299 RepID=A0ABV5KAQ1_9ACTN|nr:FHA domain-containing protein [Nocardioides plantarum]